VPASSAAAAGGAEVSAVAAVPAPLPAAATREPLLPEADLNELVAPLERSLRQRVPRQIAFRLSLLPQLWRCHADPQMVRRLLFDLVAAAAAGLKNGGELIVGTRNIAFDDASAQETPGAEAGEWARITVRDNGAGLSDEALARIFDPLDTVSPAVAGAAAAMRGSGGFARVESAEGVGTAIHLYFPRLAAASKTARAAE
jgi:signal transduction histidine kinase